MINIDVTYCAGWTSFGTPGIATAQITFYDLAVSMVIIYVAKALVSDLICFTANGRQIRN
jgi:hypothetical protein